MIRLLVGILLSVGVIHAQPRPSTVFGLQKVSYKSDGLDVFAFVYGPTAPPAEKLPVIVYNRGSYIRRNTTVDLMPMYERLGAAGFVVVAPMYRGSEGAAGTDEMGGADVHDLMNVRTVIDGLTFADTSQTFMYGESRGGMMTLQALRDGFPVRAAAVFGAFTDLAALLAEDPGVARVAAQIWPDLTTNREAIVERRSAVRWVNRIGAPLLVIHGADDTNVSPEHSKKLAALLEAANKPHELAIVPGATHTIEPFEAERDQRAVAWFRRHMATTTTITVDSNLMARLAELAR